MWFSSGTGAYCVERLGRVVEYATLSVDEAQMFPSIGSCSSFLMFGSLWSTIDHTKTILCSRASFHREASRREYEQTPYTCRILVSYALQFYLQLFVE